jgi:hypothetical protein
MTHPGMAADNPDLKGALIFPSDLVAQRFGFEPQEFFSVPPSGSRALLPVV